MKLWNYSETDEEVMESESCPVCGSTNIVHEVLPYTTEIDLVCVDCNVRKEVEQ